MPTIDLSVDIDAPRADVLGVVVAEATVPASAANPAALILLFVHDGVMDSLEYATVGDTSPAAFPLPSQLIFD